jgi:hypothetical protein
VRGDFAFGEFANAATELLLFIGKGEVHVASEIGEFWQKLELWPTKEYFISSGYQPTG